MTMKKTSNLYKRIRDAFNTTKVVLSWGETVFGWKQPNNLSGDGNNLVDLIWEPFLKERDPDKIRSKLRIWKQIRVWIMKLLGATLSERKVLLSSPPKGLQKWMMVLVGHWLTDMTPINRRSWMTAMFSTRAIVLQEDPDFSTITQDGNKPTPSIGEFVKDFWRAIRVSPFQSVPRGIQWSDWHLTSKQGPNGLAIHTLMRDYMSLDQGVIADLLVLGGPKFGRAMKSIATCLPWILESDIPTEKGMLRKVSSFGDIEGKTRIIGVLDYFSQSVLRPLHSWLFRILRRIPQDFTFDQGGFKSHIKDWRVYYSCDLTAATDRFPIDVISEVLQGVLPEAYVSSWKRLMVGLPFGLRGGTIQYARGNPMGAYSSWASFTVAHHYVMYYCCRNIGLKWRTARYAILGDDVLVGDTRLYREYRRVLELLEVPVSEAKTHESNDLCEFAKRWIYKGDEITPFPIPAMLEARNYAFLAALLCQERERGYEADIPSSIRSWFELYDLAKNSRSGVDLFKRRGHYTLLGIKGEIAETLILVFRKKLTWEEAFIKMKYAATGLGPLPYMDSKWISSFWACFLRDLWLKSSDAHMLGQMSYHEDRSESFDPQKTFLNLMRMHFDEIDDLMEDGSLDAELIPWVSLAGQLTTTSDDSYYTIVQLLRNDFTNLEGWEAIRRLILPDLGTVFRERKYNVIRVMAGKLSSDLLEIFRGRRKLTVLTDVDVGLLMFDEKGDIPGRLQIDPMDPSISLDTWGGKV